MSMFAKIYGKGKKADQPQPNRAERRAREQKTKAAQRRAQRAYDRKVKAATTKETDTA